jgi:hypothetical protein
MLYIRPIDGSNPGRHSVPPEAIRQIKIVNLEMRWRRNFFI